MKTIGVSDAEWALMKILWADGALAARDVFARVPEERAWSYRTVKTMLARLVKKNAVAYDQVGNSYVYRAACSRDELTREATKSFVHRVFDGALSPFLAGFADEASDAELEAARVELDRIIQERKRG